MRINKIRPKIFHFFYKNRRKNDALCVFVTVYIYFDDWVTLPDVINDCLKLTSQ